MPSRPYDVRVQLSASSIVSQQRLHIRFNYSRELSYPQAEYRNRAAGQSRPVITRRLNNKKKWQKKVLNRRGKERDGVWTLKPEECWNFHASKKLIISKITEAKKATHIFVQLCLLFLILLLIFSLPSSSSSSSSSFNQTRGKMLIRQLENASAQPGQTHKQHTGGHALAHYFKVKKKTRFIYLKQTKGTKTKFFQVVAYNKNKFIESLLNLTEFKIMQTKRG